MTSALIQQAVELFDLLGYVLDRGGEETQPDQWSMMCPTCGRRKLIVDLQRRAWHCWVCESYGVANPWTGRRQVLQGAGGLLDLVQFVEGWDRKRAADFVLAQTNLRPERLDRIDGDLREGALKGRDRLAPAQPIPYPEGTQRIDGALPYMIHRGLTAEDARMFGLFWCNYGRYRNRLIFPVYEDRSLVYYQGRAMWESADPGFRKALNPSREDGAAVSTEVLFNLDQARCYPRVAVVEGPIDAVRTGPDAVASFGKKISATQIAKLLRAGVRALDLMWDGPGPKEPQGAWPEMFKVAPTLATMFDVRLVFLPKGDPGAWPREANTYFRSQARPVNTFSVTMAI